MSGREYTCFRGRSVVFIAEGWKAGFEVTVFTPVHDSLLYRNVVSKFQTVSVQGQFGKYLKWLA